MNYIFEAVLWRGEKKKKKKRGREKKLCNRVRTAGILFVFFPKLKISSRVNLSLEFAREKDSFHHSKMKNDEEVGYEFNEFLEILEERIPVLKLRILTDREAECLVYLYLK